MSVFLLDKDDISFPHPTLAEPDGLLAVGGDLSVDRLLLAYSNGIFPWFDPGDEILWWCPKERFIIRPEKIHISHSMKKFMRKHDCRILLDRDFSDTMHHCRTIHEATDSTWISDEMEEAYARLHEEGFAMSVEAVIDDELAGGLYGVLIGNCFFGESMFSLLPNGSKIALILLSGLLAENDFLMIDCQFHSDHLESMGGERISWEEYEKLLARNPAIQ